MMKTIITMLALIAVAGIAVAEPQPNAPAHKPAAASQYTNQGKVLDVIDTSMYTYLQVTGDKGPIWMAISKTSIPKGATISYPNGAVMPNFYSPTLKRTFDTILFIDRVAIVKQ